MTHDELLDRIAQEGLKPDGNVLNTRLILAFRAVVELHSPNEYGNCLGCPTHGEFACGLDNDWKYCPTIQVIKTGLGR